MPNLLNCSKEQRFVFLEEVVVQKRFLKYSNSFAGFDRERGSVRRNLLCPPEIWVNITVLFLIDAQTIHQFLFVSTFVCFTIPFSIKMVHQHLSMRPTNYEFAESFCHLSMRFERCADPIATGSDRVLLWESEMYSWCGVFTISKVFSIPSIQKRGVSVMGIEPFRTRHV